MSLNVGTLQYTLEVLDKKAGEALTAFDNNIKSSTKNIEEIGKGMKSAGTQMSLWGAAITATAGYTVNAANEYDSLKESNEALAKSFNTTSDAILESLQKSSKGTISNKELIQTANRAMVLGVAKSTDDFDTLMSIAMQSAKDMGISTTQAFDNIVTGIGRASPMILDNLGIIVDADSANKKYAESIGKTVDELSKEERAQALANAVIEQGKSRLQETGDTALSNAQKTAQMTASLENLKVTIGDKLQPVVMAVVDTLSKAVTVISDWMTKNPELSTTILTIIVALGGLFVTLGPILVVLGSLMTALPILTAAFTILTGPVGIIILALGALVVAFLWVRDNIDIILPWIEEKFPGALNFLKTTFDIVSAAIVGAFNFIKNNWDTISAILIASFNTFVSLVKIPFDIMVATISGAFNLVKGAVTGTITFFTETVPKFVQSAKDFGSAMLTESASLPQKFITLAGQVIDGFIQGIKDGINRAVAAVSNFASSVIQAAKDKLLSFSPSKVFEQIGSSVGEGMAIGINSSSGRALASMNKMTKDLTTAGSSSISNINNSRTNNIQMNNTIREGIDSRRIMQELAFQINR